MMPNITDNFYFYILKELRKNLAEKQHFKLLFLR